MSKDHVILASVPRTICADIGALRQLCNGNNFVSCEFHEICIPPLKFRNLDILLETTEIISRKIPHMECFLNKISTVLQDMAGYTKSPKATYVQALTKHCNRFEWNESKYDPRESLLSISQGITHDTEEIEEAFEDKYMKYSECAKRLEIEEKKYTTNTAAIPMAYLIAEHGKKSTLPIETDFLVTLFVVIPAEQGKEWLCSYATLIEGEQILPNSSTIILSDETNVICSVMLLQKGVMNFRKVCLQRKWIVRDPRQEEAFEDQSVENLQNMHDKLRAELVRLLHASIAEYEEAYTHLRVTECYVESILKYGLPADFLAFMVSCPRSKYKHVREVVRNTMRKTNTTHLGEEELGEMEPFVTIQLFS